MVTGEPNSGLQDPKLMAEIELLGDLIEAVAQAGRRLSPQEIDRALRVAEDTRHSPAPPATAASAWSEYDPVR